MREFANELIKALKTGVIISKGTDVHFKLSGGRQNGIFIPNFALAPHQLSLCQ